MKYVFKKGERVVFDINKLSKIFNVYMGHLDGSEYEVLEDYSPEEHEFVELRSSLGNNVRVISGYSASALVVVRSGLHNNKLTIKEKLKGCAFKGTPCENIDGMIGVSFQDGFDGVEFLVDTTSGKYVYGYPVGFFGKESHRMAFYAHEVRFYHENQTSPDAVPNLTILDMIHHIDLEQVKNT